MSDLSLTKNINQRIIGTKHFFELYPEYVLTPKFIEKTHPPIQTAPFPKKDESLFSRNYYEKYVNDNDVSKHKLDTDRSYKTMESKMPVIGAESTQQEFFSNIIQTRTQKGENIDMNVFAPNPDRLQFHFLGKEQLLKLMLENQEIIIKGDYGPTGDTGAIGLQGDTGPIGLQGLCGSTGPEGQQGKKGDRGERGFPGGPTGPMGPIGFRGERGPPGKDLILDKESEIEVSLIKTETLLVQDNNLLQLFRDLQEKIQNLETRLEKLEII